jgi:IS5 family transposase
MQTTSCPSGRTTARFFELPYRGLEKNTAQLHTLFGMANLMLARRLVLNFDSRGASAG